MAVQFEPKHTDSLFELINLPEVRSGMQGQKPISYEGHTRWVQENLLDSKKVHLFIVIENNGPGGIILIKNIEKKTAEMGIMMGNIIQSRRTLLTARMVTGILHYAFEHLNLMQVTMNIIPQNYNSTAIARKIGAHLLKQDDVYQYYQLTREAYYRSQRNQAMIDRFQPKVVA